jgi:phosphatidylethanolamine/phosphatidyl-N-methylethanolamine N-methyltransferase
MQAPQKDVNPRLLFLKAWLRSPLKVGAIAPSGERLAWAMARAVPKRSSLPVVELGGGTGSITAVLREHLGPERLVVLERDPELYRLLQRRFPDVTVVLGDACHLRRHLQGCGIPRAAAVVSGLPLVAMPKSVQRQIVDESFAVMDPGSPFIQFTYSLFSPLARREMGVRGRPVARVLQNVPPASVWVYRRSSAQGARDGQADAV